ncbi:hypothetical protein RRG08_026414 [Elysia crispata]|uniref:Uncharacterized protein n=1 Tax=Elysia crispata TaxID=231223 RepID=A0AAE0XN64_9GAST|nr:hypothetical protein RRG08_026414 [Elysia crispata]
MRLEVLRINQDCRETAMVLLRKRYDLSPSTRRETDSLGREIPSDLILSSITERDNWACSLLSGLWPVVIVSSSQSKSHAIMDRNA